MRRSLAIALALLVAASASPAVARPRPLPKCAVWDDAAGDSGSVQQATAATNDPGLDIRGSRIQVTKNQFIALIRVEQLAESPRFGWGDRFAVMFTWRAFGLSSTRDVEIYYRRSRTRDVEDDVFPQEGIKVDGSEVTDEDVTATFDTAAKTVKLVVELPRLLEFIGRPRSGIGTMNAVETTTANTYANQYLLWDTAAGPAQVPLRPCK